MNKYFILLLFAMFIMISSCKKKAGIFAPSFVCKVDGEKFKPSKNWDWKLNPLTVHVLDTLVSIVALNGDGGTIAFRIGDRTGIKQMKYLLNNKAPVSVENARSAIYSHVTDSYYTDSIHTGTVEIKYIDYDEKRISGYFSFIAKHQFTSEKVEVTDGKFNLKFE